MIALVVLLTFVGLFVGPCSSLGGPKGTYSNTWLLKTDANRDLVQNTVTDNGFKTIANPFPGYYVLEKEDESNGSWQQATLSSRIAEMAKTLQASDLKQLMYQDHSTRALSYKVLPKSNEFNTKDSYKVSPKSNKFNITDSQWADMWHVKPSKAPSMGIYEAWQDGYSGKGIHVAIVDDGIEPTHRDLAANYDRFLSFDYLTDSRYVKHTGSEDHGTLCAGLVAAVKNDHCVIGTAYRSTISAVKIFNDYDSLTDFEESLALTNQLASTDIYSNSLGASDPGNVPKGPGELTKEALSRGTTKGRAGKGAIYTWAAGNGGSDDDCNCDGYANSIYTISVTSVGTDLAPAYYSEECSSIMVGTYSGDSPDLTIATTSTNDRCTTKFQGTSASCPIAAGIIALVLEANPNVTWRDVQHLIVNTSETDGLINATWQTNGAGKRVSHRFGFGLMNAANMIQRAKVWQNVPDQVVCTGPLVIVDESRMSYLGSNITSEQISDGCSGSIDSLEHVQVWISFSSSYWGRMEIRLYSPQGTMSRLLRERRNDRNRGTLEWTFMTLFTWGENPTGTWRLELETAKFGVAFKLNSWRMTMYGTKEHISTTIGPMPTTIGPMPMTEGLMSSTGSLMSTTGGVISTAGAQLCQEEVHQKGSDRTLTLDGWVIGGVAFIAFLSVSVHIVIVKIKHSRP